VVTSLRYIIQLLTSRQRRGVFLLTIAMMTLNLLDLAALSLLGLLIAFLTDGSGLGSSSILSGLTPTAAVLYLLGGSGLLFTLKTVGGIFLAKVRARFIARVEVHFSSKIAGRIFLSGLAGVKSYARPDIEWAILRSSNTAFGKILGSLLALFAELSLSVSVVILFIVIDPLSALAVMVYFSIVLVVFERFTRSKVARTGADMARGSLLVTQTVGDFLVAFKEISVLGKLDFFLEKIAFGRGEVATGTATMSYVTAVPRLIVEVALIIGAMGFFALQLVGSESPDFVVLGIFLVGSLRIMSALLPLQRNTMTLRHEIPQAEGAIALLRELSDPPASLSRPSSQEEPSFAGSRLGQFGLSVDVTDLTFGYSDGRSHVQVLTGVNMSIKAGTTVALIGPSGAGKSTLLDLILGLLHPSSGDIRFSGRSAKSLQVNFPGMMGYVPQKPGLISGTVRENVALGLAEDEVDDDQVWAALESAELVEFVGTLESGLSSLLGEHSDSLSGGQMQRFGLARALYSRPQLLVLDEATSSLDADTEASISRSLRKLGAKTTKIVVAHRLSTVQSADVVFVMEGGRVVDQGTLDELLKRNSLVRRYAKLMKVGS